MVDINRLVKSFTISFSPNLATNVEERNLGLPQDYEYPKSEHNSPSFYKNFPGNKLACVPSDETHASHDPMLGSEAGDRLRLAIQHHQLKNK